MYSHSFLLVEIGHDTAPGILAVSSLFGSASTEDSSAPAELIFAFQSDK
jgi:hypothetical protein